jgi:hypothetical protein
MSQIRASHILVLDQKLAELLKTRIEAGETFESIARTTQHNLTRVTFLLTEKMCPTHRIDVLCFNILTISCRHIVCGMTFFATR